MNGQTRMAESSAHSSKKANRWWKKQIFGLACVGIFSLLGILSSSSSLHKFVPQGGTEATSHITAISDQCQHVYNVKNIRFNLLPILRQRHENPDQSMHVHLLMFHPDSCNVFHQLWGYLARYRDAMLHGVFPLARRVLRKQILRFRNIAGTNSAANAGTTTPTIHVHVGLKECMEWLELLVPNIPIPEELRPIVRIHVHRIRKQELGEGQNEWQWYTQRYNTLPTNCYHFSYAFNTFVGFHFSFEDARQSATFTREHMQAWSQRVIAAGKNATTASSSTSFQANAVGSVVVANNDDPCTRPKPLALFVERGCTWNTRTVIDMETNQPAFESILLPKARALGYDAELLTICHTDELIDHARAFHRANVVVSSHGAQLTNLIYMKGCGNDHAKFPPALVEIAFRFAYCQTRTWNDRTNGTHQAMLQQWRQHCQGRDPRRKEHRRRYDKADFFRLATGMGIRYTEVINHALVGFEEDSPIPIMVRGIVVNSTLVVEELRKLIEDSTYDYRQHPTYNGWEGVHPYRIGRVEIWEHWRLKLLEWVVGTVSPYFPTVPAG